MAFFSIAKIGKVGIIKVSYLNFTYAPQRFRALRSGGGQDEVLSTETNAKSEVELSCLLVSPPDAKPVL